jgi:DNA-binding response OmpR family regulator
VNQASTLESIHPVQSAPELQVLVLEPDDRLAADVLAALHEAVPGIGAYVSGSLAEAQRLLLDQKPKLFVLDFDTTSEAAQDFVCDLRTSHPKARAIILTAAHFTVEREQTSGLGAIHYLEKPFPRSDFITLVEALLAPADEEGARFQGTLSDLHVSDIIQLKCISRATSMLEFTGPRGEKARVYFKNGQVRHAATGDKEGLAAFNEIVDWKGGKISEVIVPPGIQHTIDLDWQVLLMEAVRKLDESREAGPATSSSPANTGQKILLIDDSAMLLSFVKDVLEEKGYEVATAESGQEGLNACLTKQPDLILLDFVLPDMKGDEVCRRLCQDPARARIPVLYVSGLGNELRQDRPDLPNIIGLLSKPFTSEKLLNVVRQHLHPENRREEVTPPKAVEPLRTPAPATSAPTPLPPVPPFVSPSISPGDPAAVGSTREASPTLAVFAEPPAKQIFEPVPVKKIPAMMPAAGHTPDRNRPDGGIDPYLCGDSSFFSLNWALHTIAAEKLTGTLRAFWARDSVELLAAEGRVVLVTTHNPTLYCDESPVTLANVAPERVSAARERQAQNGCPLFITLADQGLILREPGLQLVQHYGQRLFSQLWSERVRFMFVQHELPEYAAKVPPSEDEIDQWTLSTLRFVQYQELGEHALIDASWIPAYTRDGFDRVQDLRLTVAEAQFASQFNGTRSIMQISKNLRLDIKFARLTLFRFLALEIVDCWPPELTSKVRPRGLRGFFSR